MQEFIDDEFMQLLVFFVINTPCKKSSARGIDCTEYGWDKNLWFWKFPKEYLLGIANLGGKTLGIAKRTDDMKKAMKEAGLDEDFYKNTDIERIAFYKDGNGFLSICAHIRNSFAHGRFAIIKKEEDTVFIMEDGVPQKENFLVRARMILKKSTLLAWMRILQEGKCPEGVEEPKKKQKKK